jgi:hypothetical protein
MNTPPSTPTVDDGCFVGHFKLWLVQPAGAMEELTADISTPQQLAAAMRHHAPSALRTGSSLRLFQQHVLPVVAAHPNIHGAHGGKLVHDAPGPLSAVDGQWEQLALAFATGRLGQNAFILPSEMGSDVRAAFLNTAGAHDNATVAGCLHNVVGICICVRDSGVSYQVWTDGGNEAFRAKAKTRGDSVVPSGGWGLAADSTASSAPLLVGGVAAGGVALAACLHGLTGKAFHFVRHGDAAADNAQGAQWQAVPFAVHATASPIESPSPSSQERHRDPAMPTALMTDTALPRSYTTPLPTPHGSLAPHFPPAVSSAVAAAAFPGQQPLPAGGASAPWVAPPVPWVAGGAPPVQWAQQPSVIPQMGQQLPPPQQQWPQAPWAAGHPNPAAWNTAAVGRVATYSELPQFVPAMMHGAPPPQPLMMTQLASSGSGQLLGSGQSLGDTAAPASFMPNDPLRGAHAAARAARERRGPPPAQSRGHRIGADDDDDDDAHDDFASQRKAMAAAAEPSADDLTAMRIFKKMRSLRKKIRFAHHHLKRDPSVLSVAEIQKIERLPVFEKELALLEAEARDLGLEGDNDDADDGPDDAAAAPGQSLHTTAEHADADAAAAAAAATTDPAEADDDDAKASSWVKMKCRASKQRHVERMEKLGRAAPATPSQRCTSPPSRPQQPHRARRDAPTQGYSGGGNAYSAPAQQSMMMMPRAPQSVAGTTPAALQQLQQQQEMQLLAQQQQHQQQTLLLQQQQQQHALLAAQQPGAQHQRPGFGTMHTAPPPRMMYPPMGAHGALYPPGAAMPTGAAHTASASPGSLLPMSAHSSQNALLGDPAGNGYGAPVM